MSHEALIHHKVHVCAEISDDERQFRVTMTGEDKLLPVQVKAILLGLADQVDMVYAAKVVDPRAKASVSEQVAEKVAEALCEHGMPHAGPCLVCHPLPFEGHVT
jgi:hypothetical protein